MQCEEPDKEGYRSSELDSLGMPGKRMNELNDRKKMRDLVENAKQTILREYRNAHMNSYSYSSSSSSSRSL